jgi:hypothetical protein
MTEINNLYGIVTGLIFVGLIVAIGVILLNNVELSVRDVVTVTAEAETQAGGAVTLTNHPLKVLTSYGNASKGYTTDFNCVGCDVNYTAATGVLDIDTTVYTNAGTAYTANYQYYKNTTASTISRDATEAVTPISGTWLPLIVTFSVLGLILSLVIGGFAFNKR